MLLVALLYFAVVDFLYVGRLAAYLAVLSFREQSLVSQTVSTGCRLTVVAIFASSSIAQQYRSR